MDLNEFFQENKRWLLGCVAGFIVYLVAQAIVGSTFSKSWRDARGSLNAQTKEPRYDRSALKAAKRQKAEVLQPALASLRDAMHFDLDKRFDLKGQGDHGIVWNAVYTPVRRDLLARADAANVDFPESSFTWQSAVERDAVQEALIGVSLVEHAGNLLIDAHTKVTEKDFAAMGLHEVLPFGLNKNKRRKRVRRRRGETKVVAADLLSEVRVTFKFTSDNATLHRFLEACHSSKPRMLLDKVKILRGRKPGDPMATQGELIALTIKPLPEDVSR